MISKILILTLLVNFNNKRVNYKFYYIL